MPEISIIIPTKDRLEIVRQCLNEIIVNSSGYDIEVIVVNDSKVLNLREALKDFSGVLVFDNPKKGVASARNYGASRANGKWLLFLDDDMVLSKKCIETYLSYKTVEGLFTVNIDWVYPPKVISTIQKTSFGRFLIKYGFTTLKGWNNMNEYPLQSRIEVDGVTSQNLFMKASDFKFAGGYNESFPMAGFEDYAMATELKKKGFKLFIDTNSQMYHNESDRQKVKDWMERKYRGAVTRKVAVDLGYHELKIEYSAFKHIIYYFFKVYSAITFLLLSFTSKVEILDAVSFSCYKYLMGLYIYKGYNTKPGTH